MDTLKEQILKVYCEIVFPCVSFVFSGSYGDMS